MNWLSWIQAHPLFSISATVTAYAVAVGLWRRLGTPALLHPVFVATAILALLLAATDTPYAIYMEQALPINESLNAIIVLLAVPFYRQLCLIRKSGLLIAPALLSGSIIALVTSFALPALEGAASGTFATLAPKSATAAVAVELSDALGGIAGLTAVIVISTGVCGAVLGPTILDAVGVEDERARGFALGVASHAIGTARAFQMSEIAGVFASLGMILNALLVIALAPLAMAIVHH